MASNWKRIRLELAFEPARGQQHPAAYATSCSLDRGEPVTAGPRGRFIASEDVAFAETLELQGAPLLPVRGTCWPRSWHVCRILWRALGVSKLPPPTPFRRRLPLRIQSARPAARLYSVRIDPQLLQSGHNERIKRT